MDVKPLCPDQPRLLISREALLHNVRRIRQALQPGTKICAMIKADAYGHGADLVIDTLCNFEAEGIHAPAVDMLGAACLEEAATLAETSLPILVLRAIENGYIGSMRQAIEYAIRFGWTLTIGSCAAADDVARIAMAIGKRAMVHVMIDSGMTRCGCAIEELPALLKRLDSHSALRLMSLGTHLATADVADHSFVHEQLSQFRHATDEYAHSRNGKLTRTVANSGGIFFVPGSHFDMVRPGISLYGIDPTCKPSIDRGLKPVARWVAPIISILPAKAGTSIGYGQSWKAPHDTRVGLIPVGYADGYSRLLGNRAQVLLHGHAVPVVGRVSMDLTTIDLHDVPAVQIGDEVTVMDSDPLSPASVYALAELSQTIPYEVFTRIGPRVKRVAVETNQSTSVATRDASAA